MQVFPRLGEFVALAMLGSACAETTPETAKEDLQAGRVDRGDPAVGLLWLETDLCTGTLIAPTIVLTAAHCVKDPVEGFYTGTGTPKTTLGPSTVAGLTRHAIAAQAAIPSYRKSACPNATLDVGLIKLAAPILNIAPAKITEGSVPRVGDTCRGVGYGLHTENGDSTFAQKRTGTQVVEELSASNLLVKIGTGLADSGDSGGPLFCGDTIYGATSCHNDGRYPQTHEREFYARVDAALPWIQEQMRKWK